jgi:hypothetical protein
VSAVAIELQRVVVAAAAAGRSLELCSCLVLMGTGIVVLLLDIVAWYYRMAGIEAVSLVAADSIAVVHIAAVHTAVVVSDLVLVVVAEVSALGLDVAAEEVVHILVADCPE